MHVRGSRVFFTANFLSERPWDLAGSGLSAFEARPIYEDVIQSIVGTKRGVPDSSIDANPVTGAWVFVSTPVQSAGSGWFVVGGTRLAAPALAGVVNAAGNRLGASHAELSLISSNLSITTDFNSISSGFCGPTGGFSAKLGWDLCTGVGSVKRQDREIICADISPTITENKMMHRVLRSDWSLQCSAES